MKFAVLPLLCLGVVPTQVRPLGNLDFQSGPEVRWQGSGFALRPGQQTPRWVGSADAPGGKALLRYVFTVPEGAGRIHFAAHAVYGRGCARTSA